MVRGSILTRLRVLNFCLSIRNARCVGHLCSDLVRVLGQRHSTAATRFAPTLHSHCDSAHRRCPRRVACLVRCFAHCPLTVFCFLPQLLELHAPPPTAHSSD